MTHEIQGIINKLLAGGLDFFIGGVIILIDCVTRLVIKGGTSALITIRHQLVMPNQLELAFFSQL